MKRSHSQSCSDTRMDWQGQQDQTKKRRRQQKVRECSCSPASGSPGKNSPSSRLPCGQVQGELPPCCRLSELSWLASLFVSVFEQQLEGGRWFLLHTDSSVASSRGLMYSNPSNSDWSILLMTSLRREGWKEQLEDLFYHRATESKPGLLLASLRWASPHLFPGLESKGSKMMFFGGVGECPCWIADHCLEHFQALCPLSYGSVFIFLAISAGISRTYLLIQIPLNLL